MGHQAIAKTDENPVKLGDKKHPKIRWTHSTQYNGRVWGLQCKEKRIGTWQMFVREFGETIGRGHRRRHLRQL